MTLAFEKLLAPAIGSRKPADIDSPPSRLHVAVVFTSASETIVALRKAGALADSLGACVALLVPQVVPYPLPLESPPVLLDFSERRFAEIAKESPVETIVRIYLCRDRQETILGILNPHSIVVVGCRKRWWPTQEKRLARQLRRAGHEVIFTETE